MKVVITGGSGFIGSHLADFLIDSDYEVVVVDNLSIGRLENISHLLVHSKFTFLQADITDFDAIEIVFKDADWVFHLAALADIVPSIENPNEYFQGRWHDEKKDELFFELHRFFHNYVASAEALVSHTRNYIKHLSDEIEIRTEYNEKIKSTFYDHAPTTVIKDLRNYFSHKGIPLSSVNLAINPDGSSFQIKILLPVENLLEWNKWSSRSKEYITMQGTEVWLKKLIATYHNNVSEFYLWFDEMLERRYHNEVVEMESLISELRDLNNRQR